MWTMFGTIWSSFTTKIATILVSAATLISPTIATDPQEKLSIPESSAPSTIILDATTTAIDTLEPSASLISESEKPKQQRREESTLKIVKQTAPVKTIETVTPVSPKGVDSENFVQPIITASLKEASAWLDLADLADLAIQYVDERLTEIMSKRDAAQVYVRTINTDTELIDILIEYYQNDIETMQGYRSKFSSSSQQAKTNSKNWQEHARKSANLTATREQFVKFLENLQANSSYDRSLETVTQTIENYNAYAKKTDGSYAKMAAATEAAISNLSSSPHSPQYFPSASAQYYVPPVQFPQTTRCTINGLGGVGIEAYVTCSTSAF